MIEIFSDGGSRGNPGHAAYGFVVKNDGKTIHQGLGYIGIETNNYAEYTAITKAYQWLLAHFKGENIKFYLDSQLVASQLSGLYKVKNPKISQFVFQLKEMEKQFGKVDYIHIPRERNKVADALVNLALDKHLEGN